MVLVFDVFSILVRLLAISAALFCVFGARGVLLGWAVLKFGLRFEVLLICDVPACFDFDDGCRSFGGVAVDVRRRINITVLYRSAILVCEIIRIRFALRGAWWDIVERGGGVCGGLKALTCIRLRSLLRLVILHGKRFDSAVRSPLPLLIAFLLSTFFRLCGRPPRLLRVLLALLLSLLPSTTLCPRCRLGSSLRRRLALPLLLLRPPPVPPLLSFVPVLVARPSAVFTSSTTSTFAVS
jgi:hypothetical protein